MYNEPYERPALMELGSLHQRTLSWMVGADGGGFGGHLSKHNSSLHKFGSFTLGSDDSDDNSGDDSYTQVKSSGSRKHGGGGGSSGDGGGGGRHGSSGGHGGFNVSDVFKGFGGSH